MGLSFQTAEERNPTNYPPSHEQIQAAKQQENPCAELQAQLDEINEFIDENRLLQKFYAWQELKIQLKDTSAEVIDDAKIIE